MSQARKSRMKFIQGKRLKEEEDLDVTPFMNLMIVLVPVLLLTMSFSQITVHEIRLPDLAQSDTSSNEKPSSLEVLLLKDSIDVYYPSNVKIQSIPLDKDNENTSYNFEMLSLVLQEVKEQLPEKKDILLLSEKSIDYQSLISAMDAIKSYQTVVAASLVEVELFPEISLADVSVK